MATSETLHQRQHTGERSMSNKVRVAYIGTKAIPSQAGADRVVEAIVKGLDYSWIEPTVYCSSHLVPKGTRIDHMNIVRIHALQGKSLHATTLFLFSALHALFFGRYDLIHLHNEQAAFVLPLLRLRYKVLATSHGPATRAREKWHPTVRPLFNIVEMLFVHFSSMVTSVANAHVDYYRDKYRKEVVFLPNGVEDDCDVDLIAAEDILRTQNVRLGEYILFAAGRMIPSKGCHLLLQAYRDIESDLKLVVVGDGSHVPAYTQSLHDLADDRVCFVPFIADKATLMALIKGARLFVFPSMVEAMSMTLLEVASMNVPVISSDIVENTSILPDRALYTRSGDVDDLAEKLRWALDHPNEMAVLAAAAKDWVFSHYRWETIIDGYESLYAELS